MRCLDLSILNLTNLHSELLMGNVSLKLTATKMIIFDFKF